jgi:ATP-dependent DNA helicase RecG
MTKTELMEIIQNGENSGVEFKRDDVHPDSLAKEMAALLNLEGGYIILGVEDDGTVAGLTKRRKEVEEWVINVARNNIQLSVIPYWEHIQWDEGKSLGIITLPADSPDKPYKAKRGNAWVTYVRVGSSSREATREEEARLYQASGIMRYDIKPVPGSEFLDLDLRRLECYFRKIRRQEVPLVEEQDSWQRLLVNTDFMVESHARPIATVGGILLFGRLPNRFLPQAGLSAVAYPGKEKDYTSLERIQIRGPITPLYPLSGEDDVIEAGVVEQAIEFVRRNTPMESWIDERGIRHDHWKDYPLDAIREAVVNAIVHRDYTITTTDIEISIYSDRLEVISPGRLPNTVTIEKIKAGYRATRNELVKEVLRDYRFIEGTGLGVPRKIIKGMLDHNGKYPDLIEEEDRFIVRLWK